MMFSCLVLDEDQEKYDLLPGSYLLMVNLTTPGTLYIVTACQAASCQVVWCCYKETSEAQVNQVRSPKISTTTQWW